MKKYLLVFSIAFLNPLLQNLLAQEDFAIIEKNINIDARGLYHNLNKTKDTLVLKSDTKINYVVNNFMQFDESLRRKPQPEYQDIYQKHYEDVPLPRTFLAWPAINAFHKDEPAFEILSLLLGGGKTSRLYRSLIFDKQIAQDFNVFLDSNEIAGSLIIDITARPEHNLVKIISLVTDAIEKIAMKPPSEKEVLQAQMTLQNHHIKSL